MERARAIASGDMMKAAMLKRRAGVFAPGTLKAKKPIKAKDGRIEFRFVFTPKASPDQG